MLSRHNEGAAGLPALAVCTCIVQRPAASCALTPRSCKMHMHCSTVGRSLGRLAFPVRKSTCGSLINMFPVWFHYRATVGAVQLMQYVVTVQSLLRKADPSRPCSTQGLLTHLLFRGCAGRRTKNPAVRVLQAECEAASTSALDRINDLHDSIPIVHAIDFSSAALPPTEPRPCISFTGACAQENAEPPVDPPAPGPEIDPPLGLPSDPPAPAPEPAPAPLDMNPIATLGSESTGGAVPKLFKCIAFWGPSMVAALVTL